MRNKAYQFENIRKFERDFDIQVVGMWRENDWVVILLKNGIKIKFKNIYG